MRFFMLHATQEENFVFLEKKIFKTDQLKIIIVTFP